MRRKKKKNRFRILLFIFLFFPPSIYSLVLTSDTNGKLMTVPFNNKKKKKEESNKNRKVKKKRRKENVHSEQFVFFWVSSSSMNNFGVFCLLFGWRPAEYWIEYAQTVCIFITRQLIIYVHNSLCCTATMATDEETPLYPNCWNICDSNSK